VINLKINLTKEDLEVLSLMEFDEETFEKWGSYSVAVELGSLSIDEDFCDAIKQDEYPETKELYKQFQINRDALVKKLKQAEETN
tara:strand:- start:3956 stop:4210 length:255 start_codon:yes stop_codon:yes gene_type:complete